MTKTFDVADLQAGGNFIKIWIHIQPDGGLSVDDNSYGNAANTFYGPGADIDQSVRLDADAVRQLHAELTGETDPSPAEELGELLASKYQGQHDAMRQVAQLCEQHNVSFEENRWIGFD